MRPGFMNSSTASAIAKWDSTRLARLLTSDLARDRITGKTGERWEAVFVSETSPENLLVLYGRKVGRRPAALAKEQVLQI